MREWILSKKIIILAIGAVGAVAIAGTSLGIGTRARPQPPGFTEGFGNSKVLAFKYPQQFFCTDDQTDDLDGPGHNGDGIASAEDPDEFQHPAMGPPGSPCIVGRTAHGSLPLIAPNGEPTAQAERIWAILPFFDGDRPPNGIIDAFDPTPGVDVQCAEPGPPTTTHRGTFGTCTMHPSNLHAEPVVTSILGGLVCGGNVPVGPPLCPIGATVPAGDIPLPNHSHIIDGDTFNPIWWQTIAVRIFDRRIWPDLNGGCPANPAGGSPCLTSLAALRQAQATPFASPFGTTQAGPDTASNVWLFFDSQQAVIP